MAPFIALTDKAWFDYLSTCGGAEGRVDEVNFWSPSSKQPLKKLDSGEPIFFRLKSPHNAIAGYGFFAHFTMLSLIDAWNWFGVHNGDPDYERFLKRIGEYRKVDLLSSTDRPAPLGCTLLRDAHFWPKERWIPWGDREGWKPNIQRGNTESDPNRAVRLLECIRRDHQLTPEDLEGSFQILDADERVIQLSRSKPRFGQGVFRSRLLDTYGRRCAITGEHTEVVLDAAHIQPYLGPRSNHVQNGLLLTKEFHALFDRGYVTVTPEHEIKVSTRLRTDFDNGRRYYPYDSRRLEALPDRVADHPSPEALEWHGKMVFLDG